MKNWLALIFVILGIILFASAIGSIVMVFFITTWPFGAMFIGAVVLVMLLFALWLKCLEVAKKWEK